ncbi:MAG: hypothetical protein GC157_12550 [Frankiales bacterium]|nr:hypothetical protein [Frankiales bacterium]
MTHPRPRRRAALAATLAAGLGLALLSAAPVQALGAGPYVVYVDATDGSMHVGDPDATETQPVSTGGFVSGQLDASSDGSVVAVVGASGPPSAPYYDMAHGLVVSDSGATQVLASIVDANPVVAPDGSSVWFVSEGDVYRWDRSTSAITRLTLNAPLAPATGAELLTWFAVSPSASSVAGVFVTASGSTIQKSRLEVDSLATANPGAPDWTVSYDTASGVQELLPERPVFSDDSTLYFPICNVAGTPSCEEWSWSYVDTSSSGNVPAAASGDLDNAYQLRLLDGTWWAWTDSGSSSVAQTSSNLVAWTTNVLTRTDGNHTTQYTPVSAAPATFSAHQASSPTATSKAVMLFSTGVVKTGGQAVFSAYGAYLKAVGGQTLADAPQVIERGAVQWSQDGGRTWHPWIVTSGATTVPWPGEPWPGNGKTFKLGRNTWFRFSVIPDVLVGKSSTSPRLVKVSPTLRTRVARYGGSTTVSGVAGRRYGTAALYKGTHKVATAKISAKGAFSFGRRYLSSGNYQVRILPDASWTKASGTVRV